MSTTNKAAQAHMKALLAEQEEAVKATGGSPTLAYYRLLMTTPIRAKLEHFVSLPEFKDETEAMPEVLEFFRNINKDMWEQEKEIWADVQQLKPNANEFPIVFGGKYAAKPSSISETLVEFLSGSCDKVYTVSRSTVKDLPSNIVHIPKSHLDVANVGADEFRNVFQQALADYKANAPDKIFTVYFTLGRHTGENPFARNVASVTNLCTALQECLVGMTNFRVVLTGTDATNPSDHPDRHETIQGQELLIPTYKIFKYNYVYAMSKIYQFYKIAHTLLGMLDNPAFPALAESVQQKLVKMKAHMDAVGNNGIYDETASNIVDMAELDTYSRECQAIQDALAPYFHVATGISICYTPLHAVPWTTKALQQQDLSPRAFLVEQVVRRLKNAISPKLAARYHFPKNASL